MGMVYVIFFLLFHYLIIPFWIASSQFVLPESFHILREYCRSEFISYANLTYQYAIYLPAWTCFRICPSICTSKCANKRSAESGVNSYHNGSRGNGIITEDSQSHHPMFNPMLDDVNEESSFLQNTSTRGEKGATFVNERASGINSPQEIHIRGTYIILI